MAATGDSSRTGAALEVEREVVLDGGSAPTISLRRDRISANGSVERPFWNAQVSAGASTWRAEASSKEWGARWIPANENILDATFRFGREAHGVVSFHQEDGVLRGTAGGGIHLGPLGVEAEASRSVGHGVVEILFEDTASVPLEWSGTGWGAQGGLSLDVASWGRCTVRLVHGEEHPSPVEGRYRLEIRTTSSGWSLDWDPLVATGPWFSLESRHVELRSAGWSDTLGSDRCFHDFLVRGAWRAASFGWRLSPWDIGAHGEERVLDAPRSSFFTPFLAWNVLDPSEWSPVDQILSDQREHLSGEMEYRSLGASASWRRTGKRLDVGLGADISWRSLEIHAEHRSSRIVFLGFGYSTTTDSVQAPRLRACLLSLEGGAAIHLGGYGSVGVEGRAAAPLWLKRLRRDGTPATSVSSGEGGGDDITGLWAVGAFWRGSW